MKIYLVEVGEYADRWIRAVCKTQEKAKKVKTEWDKIHMIYGAVIPRNQGGDGVKRLEINIATITEHNTED